MSAVYESSPSSPVRSLRKLETKRRCEACAEATGLTGAGLTCTRAPQASGMVAAQPETTVGQALVRLRAYAFGNDRRLTGVAEAVVARARRFDDRSGQDDRVA